MTSATAARFDSQPAGADSWPAEAAPGKGNFVSLVLRHAREASGRLALVLPAARPGGQRDVWVTFGQLSDLISRHAAGIHRAGLDDGARVAVLAPISIELYAITLALMACGMVPVFVDGTLHRRRMLRALTTAHIDAVIGSRRYLRWWPLVSAFRRCRRFAVDGAAFGVLSMDALLTDREVGFEPLPREPGDSALISFTSGSTGDAKGVDRTHDVLRAQHRALLACFPREDGEVDMPGFPAVALHNLCCGVPSVIPPINFRDPAATDLSCLADVVSRWRVSSLSGAPAYVSHIVRQARGDARWSTLRRLAVGGAPVSRRLCGQIAEAFPGVEARIVYGSTEAEPISHVSAREVLASFGEGILVGAPVPDVDAALVELPERLPCEGFGIDAFRVCPGDAGEVIVQGTHVSARYVNNPAAERETKLRSCEGALWHRTGDVARMDERGRLWLLGRVSEVVQHRGRVLYPLVVEELVNSIDGVRQSALVAHDRAASGELAVVVDSTDAMRTIRSMLSARELGTLPVRIIQRIPVDRRHQSKVDRGALRESLARAGGRHV
jgi:olefin beta-lactone synthetase